MARKSHEDAGAQARVDTVVHPSAVRLDFLTWNLRHAGTDLVGPSGVLSNALAALRPAVALLQECYRRALPSEFVVAGPDGVRTYRSIQGYDGGDQRLCIVYDLSQARLKSRPRQILEGCLRRAPLEAVFALYPADTVEPVDLRIANVHLLSLGGNNLDARLAEASALKDWIENEAATGGVDLLIGGDWNSLPYDETLEPLVSLERRFPLVFQQVSAGSEAGFLLANLRTIPHPEHVQGERIIELGHTEQSNMKERSKTKRAVSFGPLQSRFDGRAHKGFRNWLKAQPFLAEAPEFAPNVITVAFSEYEPD